MKSLSIGRLISFIGILILSAGLICNSFELISAVVFRAIVSLGIITETAALVIGLKQNCF